MNGWNLMTLTAIPATPLTASTMIQNINSQGGQTTSVSTLQDGVWKTFVVRGGNEYSGEDFAVELGQGYFVKNNNRSLFTFNGQDLVAPVKVSLKTGWNAIGVPFAQNPLTAASLSDKTQSEVVNEFESSLWKGFVKKGDQQYGDNFDIQPNKGYILKVGQDQELNI